MNRLGNILEVEWLDFSDELDVGGEKKKRFKGNSQVWG